MGSIKKAVGMETEPPTPKKEETWTDSFRGVVGLEKKQPSTLDSLRGRNSPTTAFKLSYSSPLVSISVILLGMVGMEVKEPTLWDDINAQFAWSLKCVGISNCYLVRSCRIQSACMDFLSRLVLLLYSSSWFVRNFWLRITC